MLTGIHAIVVAATLVAIVACVILHCMAATILMRRFEALRTHQSTCMVLMVLGLFAAHVIEILLFGVIGWWLAQLEGSGLLAGDHASGLMDYLYFSSITYTTLGYGDVYPVGALRMLFGAEALIGFMLITWSASVTFLQMQRFWR